MMIETATEAEPTTTVETATEAEPTTTVETATEAEPTTTVETTTEAEPTTTVETATEAEPIGANDDIEVNNKHVTPMMLARVMTFGNEAPAQVRRIVK